MLLSLIDDRSTDYTKVFSLFQARYLQSQLASYTSLADSAVGRPAHVDDPHEDLRKFMDAFTSEASGSAFHSSMSRMWTSHEVLCASSDLLDLRLNLHRRHLMLCSAAAWYWLVHTCGQRSQAIVAELGADVARFAQSDDWLERLCRDIYENVRLHRKVDVDAGDYFEHLRDQSVRGHIPRPHDLEEDITLRVLDLVQSFIQDWLGFPRNAERVRAHFVIYLVGAFRNPDVLVLDGVWKMYREVKARVLQLPRKTKGRYLTVPMLDEFATALSLQPLANPNSPESALMLRISSAIERCAPGMRGWTDSFIAGLLTCGTLPPMRPSRTPTTASTSHPSPSGVSPTIRTRSTDLPPVAGPSRARPATSKRVPAPGRPQIVSAPPPQRPDSQSDAADDSHPGLNALLDFVHELLPIARGELIPSPSTVQQVVMERSDHFMPFRNLATCRVRVTSPQGPFHPNNVDQPGAFPSCVITRALLFDSEVLRQETYGYFPDKSAWNDFVAAQKFDKNNKASVNRFFNMSCYGKPQNQRTVAGMQLVEEQYFAHEPLYQALLDKYPNEPIPFMVFYRWTDGKTDGFTTKGKPRTISIAKCSLLGGLTGYLLTADLYYAGKVARPTLEEVARVLHANKMGSLGGLIDVGLVKGTKKTASLEEVVDAFKRVYNFLSAKIDVVDQHLIQFDEVMVEHLLCKYSRTKIMRQKDKGKGRA